MFKTMRHKPDRVKQPVNKGMNNSIFYWNRCNGTLWAFGVVKIITIKRGVDFDIVEADSGKGYGESFRIKLLCQTTDSRKQIYTLKCNQYAIFFGMTTDTRKQYSVSSFFPSYTPLSYDIEHNIDKETKNSIETFNDNEETYEEDKDFLSQFMNK